MVNKLNLNKNIFYGYQKNKDKIFKNANLFLNASHYEGLPNALVQALNYNVFVICSNSPGGNMEVIKNGKFGLYFRNKDYKDLAKKIKRFYFLKKKYNFNQQLKHLEKYSENPLQ